MVLPLAQYRVLFDAVDQGMCIVEVLFDAEDRPLDYRFLQVNTAFEAQTGLVNAVGKTMRSLRPEHEEHWFEIYGRIALTSEPSRFEQRAAALGRWYDVYALRIGDPRERRVAILFNDITDRKRAEDRVALLAMEMEHRASNMLALIASMVRLTRADTVSAYRADLLGRLKALANSQRHLAQSHGQGTALESLVADEMAGYGARGDARVTWRGPAVALAPAAAQSVAMALHELATNATKYGALSVSEGRVTIEWDWRANGCLELLWSETGGPPVAPPQRKGLGTAVVTSCGRDQLGGEVDFDWRPDGLVCRLVVPAPTAAGGLAAHPSVGTSGTQT